MVKRQKKWFKLDLMYLLNSDDNTLVKAETLFVYAYNATAAKRTLGSHCHLIACNAVDAHADVHVTEALNKCQADAN